MFSSALASICRARSSRTSTGGTAFACLQTWRYATVESCSRFPQPRGHRTVRRCSLRDTVCPRGPARGGA
eukprot:10391283-Alexandrium_andersonii.AAC.1